MLRLIIGTIVLTGCASDDAATRSTPATPAATEGAAGAPLAEGTHRVAVDGGELVYHVHGRGPVAIAVPGGPGFAWDYLRMPELEKHVTMVYMEPIGTGESARLSDPAAYSRARDVADLETLRAHLGVPRVYVIGHSYGGFVALDHALAHQDKLAGLILYGTSPMTNEEWQMDVGTNMGRYKERAWFADAAAAFGSIDAAKDEAELLAILRRIGPLYVHDYDADKARWDSWLARVRLSFERSNRGTNTPYDVRARLPELKLPALILVGATDFICSPKMAALIAAGIPGAKLVTFEKSGHVPHLEEPAPFAEAVRSFVAEAPR